MTPDRAIEPDRLSHKLLELERSESLPKWATGVTLQLIHAMWLPIVFSFVLWFLLGDPGVAALMLVVGIWTGSRLKELGYND